MSRSKPPSGSIVTRHQQVSVSYSGSLPPARELQAMAQIDPDFPNRIMHMAEKEQEFRHRFNMSLAVRAQYMTGAVVFAGLAAAVIIAFSGSTIASGAIAISTIVSAAVASLWGRKTL